uniref:Tetraspanin n=1 Tax=Myripristis murdjan TaxID=586833 RepID=A0A667XCN1_9TELE
WLLGCWRAIRCLLFTFNLLFFIAGIIILGLSTHIQSNRADYQITDELLPAITLLIFVGAVTLVFGFLGCCGAIKESRCLLALFFTDLLCMFLMLLAVGGLGVVARSPAAREQVKVNIEKMIPLSAQPKDVQESFQEVERTLKCCGFFDGHLDWGNSSTVVPNSCNCTDTSRNCTFLDGLSDVLIGTAFSFSIFMILGMGFSSILICQISVGKNSII